MRTSNGQRPVQRYRVINNNRKLKIIGKVGLTASQKQANKRFTQTKLMGRTQRHLSPEDEEIEDDELDNLATLSEMDYISEAELEQADHQKGAFKALTATVRPLLQLFSEEAALSTNNSATSVHSTNVTDTPHSNEKIIYKNICITSEDEAYAEETASIHEERNIFHSNKVASEKHTRTRFDSLSRFEWSPKSTNIFLDLWERHLKDIRGNRKKAQIHKEMAEEMSEYGPSPREIKSKMDNMSRKYRLELKKNKSGSPTTWRYFKRVEMLLIGTPSVDFEEIIFDNTESSSFFNADSSDEEIEMKYMSREDKETEQSPPTPAEEPEKVIPNEPEKPQEEVEHKKSKRSPSMSSHQDFYSSPPISRPADRMVRIQEQKLAIERQKLQVMKHISRELKSISKTLVELLRNKK